MSAEPEDWWWRDCELCGDTGWVQIPDPYFGGATTDQRCPACQDTTVRARRNCFEMNDGTRVGPKDRWINTGADDRETG